MELDVCWLLALLGSHADDAGFDAVSECAKKLRVRIADVHIIHDASIQGVGDTVQQTQGESYIGFGGADCESLEQEDRYGNDAEVGADRSKLEVILPQKAFNDDSQQPLTLGHDVLDEASIAVEPFS